MFTSPGVLDGDASGTKGHESRASKVSDQSKRHLLCNSNALTNAAFPPNPLKLGGFRSIAVSMVIEHR